MMSLASRALKMLAFVHCTRKVGGQSGVVETEVIGARLCRLPYPRCPPKTT
jgi:hypothetical protein